MTTANRIWDRAVMEGGGTHPRPGDIALSAVLRVHGLIMNGGVHHAIECVDPMELMAAADGYAFFGLDEVAAFFRRASTDPILSNWTDATEVIANEKYSELVPDDAFLVAVFERSFWERSEQFSPL